MRHAPCGSPGPAHPLVLCSDVFLPLVSVYLTNVRKKLRLSVKPYWKFRERARGYAWRSNDSSSIAPWKMSNSHGAIFYSPRRKESFLPKYHLIVPKFHLIAPKYYFFPTWGFFISSGGIWKSPRENFQILNRSHFDSSEREVPTHEKKPRPP